MTHASENYIERWIKIRRMKKEYLSVVEPTDECVNTFDLLRYFLD